MKGIVYFPGIQAMRGKFAQNDYKTRRKTPEGEWNGKSYFYGVYNTQTGAAHFGLRIKPLSGTYTDKQTQVQNRFKTVIAAVNAAMLDPDKLEQYTTAWKKQQRYPTFRGFVFSKEWEKLG